MDHFLVWGEDYRAIREAVAKATMKGGTEGIDEACEVPVPSFTALSPHTPCRSPFLDGSFIVAV